MVGLWWIGAGTGQNTGKTVAIILGGAAALGFVVIFMLFARNLMKKHDGMQILKVRLPIVFHSIFFIYVSF